MNSTVYSYDDGITSHKSDAAFFIHQKRRTFLKF